MEIPWLIQTKPIDNTATRFTEQFYFSVEPKGFFWRFANYGSETWEDLFLSCIIFFIRIQKPDSYMKMTNRYFPTQVDLILKY